MASEFAQLDQAPLLATVRVLGSYSDADTTIDIDPADAGKLPAVDSADPSTWLNATWSDATIYPGVHGDPQAEVVRVTNNSAGTLSLARAQEGTSATTKSTPGSQYVLTFSYTPKFRTDIDRRLPVNFGSWNPDNTGTIDVSALLLEAADAAALIGVPLEIPAGTFLISNLPLTGGRSYIWVGRGRGLTRILRAPGSTGAMVENTSHSSRVTDFELRDITIDGNQGLVALTENSESFAITADRIDVQRCTFRNTLKAAFSIENVYISATFRNCHVDEPAKHGGVTNLNTYGFRCLKSEANESLLTVDGCIFTSSDTTVGGNNPGAVFVNADDPSASVFQRVKVVNCQISGYGTGLASNTVGAIHIYRGAHYCYIAGNTIERVGATAGIRVQKSIDFQILGNTINGIVGGAGCGDERCDGISVEHRLVEAGTEMTTRNAIVANNVVYGLTHEAIPARGPSWAFKFLFDYDEGPPIVAEHHYGVTLSGNRAENCVGALRMSEVAGDVHIVDNTFKTITGDPIINGGQQSCVILQGHHNSVFYHIDGNHFEDTQDRAVQINGETEPGALVHVRYINNQHRQCGLHASLSGGVFQATNLQELTLGGNRFWQNGAGVEDYRVHGNANADILGLSEVHLGSWILRDVPAGVTQELAIAGGEGSPLISRRIAHREGFIVATTARVVGDVTAGSISCRATVNGANPQAVDENDCVLSPGANNELNTHRTVETVRFLARDELGVEITTSGDLAPTTSDLVVDLYAVIP